MTEPLSMAAEDYLVTIYNLEKSKKVARSKDIVEMQKVAKSTVTAALKFLASKKLINYQPYEHITLTEEGMNRAKQLCLRKAAIRDFLTNFMQLSPIQADTTADAMEHCMEPAVLRRFVCFMTFFKDKWQSQSGPINEFKEFISSEKHARDCGKCLARYASTLDL
ncbi:MAG: metal-dependent transcriptional regulator [Candidatus Riflebacteria bacterium HGW-Riflebacteria-2]|jgi:DtxR family Mn-dependent transcriptional regulator|nr:MAG: metal-dependent transcriptional regulator [Candidatus Riflebacteria bacterium HGW-Riflebacteria-2]